MFTLAINNDSKHVPFLKVADGMRRDSGGKTVLARR